MTGMELEKPLNDALAWRYAVKQFEKKKLSSAQEKALLHVIAQTPTSYGIEPYKIFVIESSKLREELRKAAWNQSQVTDAGLFLVFAARTEITEKDVDEFMQRIAATRGVDIKSLDGYKQMVMGPTKLSAEQSSTWAKKQAYIALGNVMTSAALLGIDTCPMEGFDPAAFDKILGLHKKGYASTVCLAVGYRDPADKYAQLKKVRKGEKLLFERM